MTDTPNQGATRCDGNHGGPRCGDPACWNDDSADLRSCAEQEAGYCENVAQHRQSLLPHEVRRVAKCLRDLLEALSRHTEDYERVRRMGEAAQAARETAQADLAAARQSITALRAYVQHQAGCPAIADDESDQVLYDYGECACGLSALITPEAPR